MRWGKLHINPSRNIQGEPCVNGAPVQVSPVSLQVSTQRYSSWQWQRQIQRGREKDWISYGGGYWREAWEREDVSWFHTIVMCHFHTTKSLTVTGLFSSSVDMCTVEGTQKKWLHCTQQNHKINTGLSFHVICTAAEVSINKLVWLYSRDIDHHLSATAQLPEPEPGREGRSPC